MSDLFPTLYTAPERPALRFDGRGLSYGELAAAATGLARRMREGGAARVALWATPTVETAVGVVAGLLAGVPVVPLNPRTGERELAHILADSDPDLVLVTPGAPLPDVLGGRTTLEVGEVSEAAAPLERDGLPVTHDPLSPALVVYTSGTTGPPKGAVLPRRAIAANLDALAEAWKWTGADVLVHALPLFHVHGLILGVLGPLRLGGELRHLGRFSVAGVARELAGGGTVLFGVPTMYHRLAEAVDGDPELRAALTDARLLVSGSAALPLPVLRRIETATGRRIVERYGMTETLISTSVRPGGGSAPGTVGLPLHGVGVRLVDEDGTAFDIRDGQTIGEVQVRGEQLFTEYLNRPDATAAAHDGDWFRTGDMAVRESDGSVRIVGRRATDLIKSGGYKIGAGEIENVLLDHPGVREAAVTGEPDADLGERVVAWIVPAGNGEPPSARELADHVAAQLAPHKRPRDVRFLTALPRNDMGKVMKRALTADPTA
ncbi:acyl-CoA synthetase [Streptomyces clavuligerus]|uniref:acyl-CoA synthetase n=1 Tax=Streptomyces clavuligerus TaxID=1901 RepID=UPI00017FF760|nr:acyl-CoA synthetase [Streptomyces clavuligerus]EDY48590.1 acyl-CoA synthetase [Streptomyces clavuligerus]MBY6305006.1 acyl-CoA synthetase [Streptomyces clavuligerus]QPL66692.1 acyl-CoA synthetase [Streptomyces clavuligerus]QPL72721.1 acyl-CoA synthetase [Streptomyces clavuligerus]QPL78799.1 acyl-CoA synthetase [Streptomyces clavuligerus]